MIARPHDRTRSRMIQLIEGAPEGVLAFEAVGEVDAEDYEDVLKPAIEEALAGDDRLRFVFEIGSEFDRFTAGAAWDDMALEFAHSRRLGALCPGHRPRLGGARGQGARLADGRPPQGVRHRRAQGRAGVGGLRRMTAGPGTIYLCAPVNALVEGIYQERIPLTQIRRHGDFGLGTFDSLDGEMVLLDGRFYQVTGDGVVREVREDEAATPFACVTFFEPVTHDDLDEELDYAAFQEWILGLLPSPNLFYALRIEGSWADVKVRSVPRQENYRPLVEVAKHQPEFVFDEAEGTLAGFYSPAFLESLSVPGLHLHFLSERPLAGRAPAELPSAPRPRERAVHRDAGAGPADEPRLPHLGLPPRHRGGPGPGGEVGGGKAGSPAVAADVLRERAAVTASTCAARLVEAARAAVRSALGEAHGRSSRARRGPQHGPTGASALVLALVRLTQVLDPRPAASAVVDSSHASGLAATEQALLPGVRSIAPALGNVTWTR